MPSASLAMWRNTRMAHLREIDAQCAGVIAATPPNPRLAEENVRSYGLLLSAHFQGYCRDLYTECAQIIASKVRNTLQALVQAQFTAHRALDHGNPNLQNIRRDLERFGFALNLAGADPANPMRITHLSELNVWRNIAAHHGVLLPTGLPPITDLRNWLNSCDGLAASLDRIMYNQLRRLLRREPWPREERTMPTSKKLVQNLVLGDRVKIRHTTGLKGRIVELRGPLGPGGVQVYRVRVRRKPKPTYIEVRGDQLEILQSDT